MKEVGGFQPEVTKEIGRYIVGMDREQLSLFNYATVVMECLRGCARCELCMGVRLEAK